jgi:hypothetical protein
MRGMGCYFGEADSRTRGVGQAALARETFAFVGAWLGLLEHIELVIWCSYCTETGDYIVFCVVDTVHKPALFVVLMTWIVEARRRYQLLKTSLMITKQRKGLRVKDCSLEE